VTAGHHRQRVPPIDEGLAPSRTGCIHRSAVGTRSSPRRARTTGITSASAAPGTTVRTGRTFPTGVGAPILLEHTKITRRVRPLHHHPHVPSIARRCGRVARGSRGSGAGPYSWS
jgi:hypothetical protein